jgi:hypothetical protein
MIDAYLEVLELAYFEVGEAFKGLGDENVWKRPADGLLSIGELAGHIAYWEAVRLAGEGEDRPPDLEKCHVKSLLIDARFSYYPSTLSIPPSEQQLAMTTEQVGSELLRIHKESVAYFKSKNPDLNTFASGHPQFKYSEYLKYAIFHVSYHTGQMYSVRHLLGEVTPDN